MCAIGNHLFTGSNALQFNNITTLGALSFGEWTNGTAANGTLDYSDKAISLSAGQRTRFFSKRTP